MGNKWGCSGECGDVRPPPSCRGVPSCAEHAGSRFFDDDALLLERLEAAEVGDMLLTKLHVYVALFSQTSSEIVDGVLRLSRQPQAWQCGDEGFVRKAIHDELLHHAKPPVATMKALQWVYRGEEMPAASAHLARYCVLVFFTTMLTAGAALKWQLSPPRAWRERGVLPSQVLRSSEVRLKEVVASLRFLSCLALLQHCADPSLLGSYSTMQALSRAVGLCSSASVSAPRLSTAPLENLDSGQPPVCRKAATGRGTWTEFFACARQQPTEAVTSLLQDLGPAKASHGAGCDGPRLATASLRACTLDTWDDEVVHCPFTDAEEDCSTPLVPEKTWAPAAVDSPRRPMTSIAPDHELPQLPQASRTLVF